MSQLEVDKVIPQSGTTLTIGDSGDTITIASGATLSGDLNASNLTSGTVPDARITGTYTGITGLDLTDNSKIRLGTGNDLQIYHDGSNSYIDEQGTGSLFIRGANTVDIIKPDGTEYLARFVSDSYNKLYYDGSERFETTSGGVAVTGDLTVDTNTLYVKSSNDRVGIGNSNPQNKLDISALTWDDGILIKNTGNFNTGIIADANRSSVGGGLLNLQGRWNGTEVASVIFQAGSDTTNKDDGEIVFRTASAGTPTERVRIDSSGNLLVGKTSGILANVGHEFNAGSYASHTRDGDVTLYLNRKSSNGTIQEFRKDNTAVGSIGVFGQLVIGTNNTGLRFNDGSTSHITPFKVSNYSNTASTISLGHTAIPFKDIYLSGGAFIGGMGAANKLSDYEEGTWTPTAISTGDWSGFVHTNMNVYMAQYTKVGRKVTIMAGITFPDSGSSALSTGDAIQLSGLPFSIGGSGTDDVYGAIPPQVFLRDSTNGGIAHANISYQDRIAFRVVATHGSGARYQNGLRLSCTYFTD